jgi:orotate phosphoribosyltransferase
MLIQIEEYQKSFIRFLLQEKALLFGEFKIKSGRLSPYFLNFGKLHSGSALVELGNTYAAAMKHHLPELPSIVFGPSYKGIPLSVATTSALYKNYQHNADYCFDRKEAKTAGEGGMLVGKVPTQGDTVALVEDVITAGTTIKKIVPILLNELKVTLLGICIAVDRCEVGEGTISAKQEMENLFKIPIHPLVSIHHIISYLSGSEAGEYALGIEQQEAIKNYLSQYGAKES